MLKSIVAGLLVAGSIVAPCSAQTPAAGPAAADMIASTDGLEQIPSPEGLTMPRLDFAPSDANRPQFEKYFFFHRDNTSFEEAYADIRECDALASGSSIYMGASDAVMQSAVAQAGMAGALGGALGSAIADAIFGSAARREQRRVNLRNCMAFKQYARHGLPKELWTEFNFEEGLGRKREPVRLRALALQALVASGPKPKTRELGL